MAGPLVRTRAIVFDLDGTLIDSLPDIAGHLNAALADAGLPTHSLAAIQQWVGQGAEKLVRAAVPSSDDVATVLAGYAAHYRRAPYARTRVFPGLDATLDALAGGRMFAVLSNKPHDLVVEIVAALLARWPFGAIVGERPGRARKPDPDTLLEIADALDVSPDRCALVGDSEIDIATAQAAAMPSVAVTWGLRDASVIAHADYVVDTPAELATLFSGAP